MSSRNRRFCSRNFSYTETRSHLGPIWNCVCQGLFCREHSLNTHFLLQIPLQNKEMENFIGLNQEDGYVRCLGK